MIGLPTRLVIADQVRARLVSDGEPDGAVITANRPWFMLGALGPALGDFVPHEPPAGFGAPGRTPYYAAWKDVLEIAVGDSTQTPPVPGAVPTLRTLIQTLTQLIHLVQDHDFDGVIALRDSGGLDAVNTANQNLATILQNFSNPAYLQEIGNAVGPLSRPRIDNPLSHSPPNVWAGRDYLHWKRTGDFAARLLEDARASGDDRFVAYALGWQVAFAALLCGAASSHRLSARSTAPIGGVRAGSRTSLTPGCGASITEATQLEMPTTPGRHFAMHGYMNGFSSTRPSIRRRSPPTSSLTTLCQRYSRPSLRTIGLPPGVAYMARTTRRWPPSPCLRPIDSRSRT